MFCGIACHPSSSACVSRQHQEGETADVQGAPRAGASSSFPSLDKKIEIFAITHNLDEHQPLTCFFTRSSPGFSFHTTLIPYFYDLLCVLTCSLICCSQLFPDFLLFVHAHKSNIIHVVTNDHSESCIITEQYRKFNKCTTIPYFLYDLVKLHII